MYYFEYDKSGYLIKYIETDKEITYSGVSISKSSFYCTIKDGLVKRYEENGLIKTMSKYQGSVKLKHHFSEGESWIKVVKKNIASVDKKDYLPGPSSIKETNYPWSTCSADTFSNKYVNNHSKSMNEYAFPVSVISLEGDNLSHLKFKVKSSFLDKWNNLIDF